MLEAVLLAAESIVTFRRRYRTRTGVDAVLELLVIDPFNPRSVAYQLQRIRIDLRALPNTSPTARPLRLLDAWPNGYAPADPVALADPQMAVRSGSMSSSPGFRGNCELVRRDP